MPTVELAEAARRFFEDADAPLQRRLDRCFNMLAVEPRRHNNIKPLHGQFAGFWRYRVGDYRVIYSIDDAADRVSVTAIVHRREAYD